MSIFTNQMYALAINEKFRYTSIVLFALSNIQPGRFVSIEHDRELPTILFTYIQKM